MFDRVSFLAFLDKKRIFELDKPNIISYFQLIDDLTDEKLASMADKSECSFYWNKPINGTSFLAAGKAKSVNENAKGQSFKIASNIELDALSEIPIVVGGMKFPSSKKSNLWNDFEEQEWFVPQILFYKSNDKSYLIINTNAEELKTDKSHLADNIEDTINKLMSFRESINDDFNIKINNCSSFENWNEIVTKSLAKIKSGYLSKVVLARCIETSIEPQPKINFILNKLKEEFPNCYVFAFKKSDSIFFGATPEQLMKINKDKIETEALAGTITRGKSDKEDEELAYFLLNNKKELAEHKSVLDFLVDALTGITEKIKFDNSPRIKKLHFMQHLWSKISAKLKTNETIFSVINKIYPTPAVCGLPIDSALTTIKESEDFDRGMYAGLIGWFDNDGNGDFAVAIRSALLKNKKLFSFAGCGIVEGSDSRQEFNETELKFKPIISLFQNETISQS